jgi:hypothetical protein
MESLLPLANMSSTVDTPSARVLIGKNLTYYVAIATTLLIAYLLQPRKYNSVVAPFYKASRMKWMFSADSLVRDSYNKVSSPHLTGRHLLFCPKLRIYSRIVPGSGVPDQVHRGNKDVDSRQHDQ